MSELVRGMKSFQYLRVNGVFQTEVNGVSQMGMNTLDLIETQPYPISDVWEDYQRSQSIPKNVAVLPEQQADVPPGHKEFLLPH